MDEFEEKIKDEMELIAEKLATLIEQLTDRDEPYMEKMAAVMKYCDKDALEEFQSWFTSDDEEEDDE